MTFGQPNEVQYKNLLKAIFLEKIGHRKADISTPNNKLGSPYEFLNIVWLTRKTDIFVNDLQIKGKLQYNKYMFKLT